MRFPLALVLGAPLLMLSLNGFAHADSTRNALTNNALTNNAITANAITANAITANAISANAISARALSEGALVGSALSELNGVKVEGVVLPAQSH